MAFKRLVRAIIRVFHRAESWSREQEEGVYEVGEAWQEGNADEIHSVWDYLEFRPNTQAWHLASVLGFDEWTEMAEIRRRIKEFFDAEYKNERSLYPYLKTLTDVGLVENSSIGGKMRWRKHDILVKIEKKQDEKRLVAVEGKTIRSRRRQGKSQGQEMGA